LRQILQRCVYLTNYQAIRCKLEAAIKHEFTLKINFKNTARCARKSEKWKIWFNKDLRCTKKSSNFNRSS